MDILYLLGKAPTASCSLTLACEACMHVLSAHLHYGNAIAATILPLHPCHQVRAAYSSGNPALGVGAGNTPAVIDETADIQMAVSSILVSKVGAGLSGVAGCLDGVNGWCVTTVRHAEACGSALSRASLLPTCTASRSCACTLRPAADV